MPQPRGKMTDPTKKVNMGATLFRLLKSVGKYYKWELIVVGISILLSAVGGFSNSIFIRFIVDDCITPAMKNMEGGMAASEALETMMPTLMKYMTMMIIVYSIGLIASTVYTQIMAYVTQGYLHHLREDMFNHMESLPIKYFDTHKYGDIMSYYTNDVDAIRQLLSQSMPQLINTVATVSALIVIMFTYSLWLTLVIGLGVVFMSIITKSIGGRSAKYFVKQQISVGKTEGFIEEMMNGQKVVKVFNHEEEALKAFDRVNKALYQDMKNAHTYANILMPAMGNLGNIIYVLLALVGSILVIANVPNVSLKGIDELTVGTVIAFLTIGRGFTHNIANAANQVNSVVMGMAGAARIFELMDEKEEADEGYVTLVNANIDENGNITESETRTGKWAWKHPHKADGSITYTKLEGLIQLFDVDFGYNPDKIVLHDVTIDAKPGQKIAFVGATGAGKATITNLINRFYDIADGKIRYDNININKIKKADLRRSLGIVLQDTNLFTGTVRENIRFGKLDATDEEIIEAAKIANAHDFITRLPEGYDTMLTADGTNLSQGQRQLISIARAAVSKAPVMIMDEATSSIDTRTEALVQKGTDALMEGRTVFVIAHRLSTVQNADVIIVLDQGRIIEQGSHSELIAKKGKYYQLYTGAFELE